MANWDVFHGDRLEIERGLDDGSLRAALARGDITVDDLVRPAGSATPWTRLADLPELLAPPAPPENKPEPEPEPESEPTPTVRGWGDASTPTYEEVAPEEDDDEARLAAAMDAPDFEQADSEGSRPVPVFEFDDEDAEPPPPPKKPASIGPILPRLDASAAIPVPGSAPLPWGEDEADLGFDDEEPLDPLVEDDEDEDEAIAEFTLARGSAETVEELDLAAMVDVAFQLVLFFLVTATTILYKSLEVPKPNPDAPPEAVAQARAKSLDELDDQFILVEIDPAGTLKIDRQPVPGTLTMQSLAGILRQNRADTQRKAMLLSADFSTPHRLAVLAYDAANEIGLGIAIAKPAAPGNNAPPPPIQGPPKGG